MLNGHFCQEHQSRFFRNKKSGVDGQLKVWYSHKKADGSGFCVERDDIVARPKGVDGMYVCNAMNNAVALAASGRIELDQIGIYFKKILSELEKI